MDASAEERGGEDGWRVVRRKRRCVTPLSASTHSASRALAEPTQAGKRASALRLHRSSSFRKHLRESRLLKRCLSRLPASPFRLLLAVGTGQPCASTASCEQIALLLELAHASDHSPPAAVVEPCLSQVDFDLLRELNIRPLRCTLSEAQNWLFQRDDKHSAIALLALHCDGNAHLHACALARSYAPQSLLLANTGCKHLLAPEEGLLHSQMQVYEEELLEPSCASSGSFNDTSAYYFANSSESDEDEG